MQGDCLEMLARVPAGSVNMILTDPPYGMSFQSGWRKERHAAIANDSCLDWLEDFVEHCWRVAADNSAHYFFCSFHRIDKFKVAIEKRFKIKNCLVWEKNNASMGDLKADFAPKVEFVIFAQKGRRLIEGKRDPNIFKFARTQNELHPTQKPVDLCEYLMGKFSSEGDWVLDPFMGSGTTGTTAKNLKRNFIGIELNPEYFATAQGRIVSAGGAL